MKDSRAIAGLPISVRRALTKLGEDLSAARKRRRLTMEIVAERAFVSRKTVGRVERGDPSVSIGIYATVLFVLGLVDRLAALADVATDELGRSLEVLPKRVRQKAP
jgi:transcriptional regulator with XRE-family HTH domain